MKKILKKDGIMRNVLYTFGAQGMSMLLSVLMSLVLPRVLGVADYSYWQLFVFYISYAGFFHLGLNDGMYLKQGGKAYIELDFRLLNTHLILITAFQLLVTILGCVMLEIIGIADSKRVFVMVCTLIYMVIYNYSGYLSYVLQISNRIKAYSVSVVIEKVIFIVVMIAGIITNATIFTIYIILNIIAKICGLLYTAIQCQEIVFAKPEFSRVVFKDFFDNIQVGINITISSVAGMLVLGIGRNLIDTQWGVETFGKFSLAISLSNFLLQFISQVSLVLFPTLKRADENKVVAYYHVLRDGLSFVLLGILLGYMPLFYLLQVWLPSYADSLRYMVILLPICVFDGKMNLLCNTYLKALRKERQLLWFNLIALFVSAGLCTFGAYVLKNVFAVAISMVIAVAVRSIISEEYLRMYFHEKISMDTILDCLMCLIFVCGTWFTNPLYGFVLYLIAYIMMCILCKKKIIGLLEIVKG